MMHLAERIDVLIITAIKLEYDALLQVDTGASTRDSWQKGPGPSGFEVAFRSFQAADGSPLGLAATYALEMGGVATANVAAPLVTTYRPVCLAMCGVCAGRKSDVRLGDVIVADRLWTYNTGRMDVEYDANGHEIRRFQADPFTYNLHAVWRQRAENFQLDGTEPWLTNRPRSYEDQADWLLSRLLAGEDAGGHPDRFLRCSDFARVVQLLRASNWLEPNGLLLADAGRAYIEDKLLLHPDGIPEPPPFKVHVGPIGTGTEVVRDPLIFDKLSERMRKVLGLEMEAAAIGAVAHQLDVRRMIVMKGVMDYADPEKNDNFKWFAARASAECLIRFLRAQLSSGAAPGTQRSRFELQELEQHHRDALRGYLDRTRLRSKAGEFIYTVSMTSSQEALVRREYGEEQSCRSLAEAGSPRLLILHGGGGAGKSHILSQLLKQLVDSDVLPVPIDLSARHEHQFGDPQPEQTRVDPRVLPYADLEALIRERGPGELRLEDIFDLKDQPTQLVFLIDGINEVGLVERDKIVQQVDNLLGELPNASVVIADRFGSHSYPARFAHARVNPLGQKQVREVIDRELGEGHYSNLGANLHDILSVPFFLNLYVEGEIRNQGIHTKAGIFKEYIEHHMRCSSGELELVASAVYEATNKCRKRQLDRDLLPHLIGDVSVIEHLVSAGMLEAPGDQLSHHLWQDFLSAYHIVRTGQAVWNIDSFDAVTFDALSADPLTLAAELIDDLQTGHDFVTRVYDWNYYLSFSAIREAQKAGKQICSADLTFALFACFAEKRFDRVGRTGSSASSKLKGLASGEYSVFSVVNSLDELLREVSDRHGGPWYEEWKALFTKRDVRLVTSDLDQILSDDAVMGWTTANVARRCNLNPVQLGYLRGMLRAATGDRSKDTARWRIVHALGTFPSSENTKSLLRALDVDPYRWVKYGAARSLVEMAALSSLRGDGSNLRQEIFDGLIFLLPGLEKRVRDEIGHAGDYAGAPASWYRDYTPVLEVVRACARNQLDQDTEDWGKLLREFNERGERS